VTTPDQAPLSIKATGRLSCPLSVTALRRAILDDHSNATRLAEQCDVSPATAARWLAGAGLGRPDPLLTPEILYAHYVDAGMTVRQIAAQANVGKNRVLRALAIAGIPPRPRSIPKPRVDPVSDEDIRLAYVDLRLSLDSMVLKFGATRYYLQQRIRELGLSKRSGSHTARSMWNADELAGAVRGQADTGTSIADIATALGVSTSTVRLALHRCLRPINRTTNPAITRARLSQVERLYADSGIQEALHRHNVEVPALNQWCPASPWTTYAPCPLSADLVRELYSEIGLSIQSIAWLCGVSTATVRKTMNRGRIPARLSGERAPWSRRTLNVAPRAEVVREYVTNEDSGTA
jgi:transposase-like protein